MRRFSLNRKRYVEATVSPRLLNTGSVASSAARRYVSLNGKPGDDAGHIIARVLGGSGEIENIFPQHAGVCPFLRFLAAMMSFRLTMANGRRMKISSRII